MKYLLPFIISSSLLLSACGGSDSSDNQAASVPSGPVGSESDKFYGLSLTALGTEDNQFGYFLPENIEISDVDIIDGQVVDLNSRFNINLDYDQSLSFIYTADEDSEILITARSIAVNGGGVVIQEQSELDERENIYDAFKPLTHDRYQILVNGEQLFNQHAFALPVEAGENYEFRIVRPSSGEGFSSNNEAQEDTGFLQLGVKITLSEINKNSIGLESEEFFIKSENILNKSCQTQAESQNKNSTGPSVTTEVILNKSWFVLSDDRRYSRQAFKTNQLPGFFVADSNLISAYVRAYQQGIIEEHPVIEVTQQYVPQADGSDKDQISGQARFTTRSPSQYCEYVFEFIGEPFGYRL